MIMVGVGVGVGVWCVGGWVWCVGELILGYFRTSYTYGQPELTGFTMTGVEPGRRVLLEI